MAWNRPNEKTVDATSSSRSSGRGKMPRLRRGLLAGAIVVLGAGLAAWLLTNGEAVSSPLQKKERGLIKEVSPAAAPKAVVTVPAETNKKVRAKGEPESVEVLPNGDELWTMPDGHKRLVVDHYKLKEGEEPHKPLFEHHLENVLVLFADPCADVPPLPDTFTDDEVKQALASPIEVDFENEREDIVAKKLAVAQLKDDLRGFMAKGGTAQEYISRLEQEQQTTVGTARMAEDMIRQSLKEGHDDEAREFYDRVDKMLKDKGLPGFRVNGYMRYRLGLNTKKGNDQ